MLSKVVSSSIFKVFGMTRPGIEPRSPGALANTLTAGPMSRFNFKYNYHYLYFIYNFLKQFSLNWVLDQNHGNHGIQHGGYETKLLMLEI